MMQDNDGLITCPYIGDLFFCPSQACLKNYKLNKKMKFKNKQSEAFYYIFILIIFLFAIYLLLSVNWKIALGVFLFVTANNLERSKNRP